MKIISRLFALLALLLVLMAAGLYWFLQASLPDYHGGYQAAVAAPVTLSRDELGYLTVHASDRSDAAFALGFAHAQERFFQMDLSRRFAAGELAALLGNRALEQDKQQRLHLFRHRAEQLLTTLPAAELQLLAAYSRGVNEGLASLSRAPFEYSLLQSQPEPWLEADTLLVIYSMYLDLQGKAGRDEYAMTQLQAALPADWYRFLQQHSSDWQAAIDQSEVAAVAVPDSPYPTALQQLQSCQDCTLKDATDLGSNNFAVAGSLTSHSAAILADDMHLSQRVPGIWYKVQLNWQHNGTTRQVTGLSLPGTPAIVVGSNGKIAWGFTNTTADWHDLVKIELSADQQQYLGVDGWQQLRRYQEQILVKDAPVETLTVQYTEWGPLVSFADNQPYALRWIAHEPYAVNFTLRQLELADNAAAALALAPEMGIPAQNLLVADAGGNIGWTVFGPIPERKLQDWDTAQYWHQGDNYWRERIAASAYPHIFNPASGRLWSANARTVGGEVYQLLGNGGYDLGARGRQIADSLREASQFDEQALHQIQLDHRAILLQRWQQLLLNELSVELAAQLGLSEFRQHIAQSADTASPEAIGYTLLRQFRLSMLELTFAPVAALLEQAGARSSDLKYSLETPFWLLWQQQRPDTLPASHSSWQDLLLSAAQDSQQKILTQYGSLQQANWGKRNSARIEHPLASAIPLLGRWLNMPATPLAGDSHMPRVQHAAFGQSQRMVVAPGQEQNGILVIPAGQSGHPLSPFYRADHRYWQAAIALPFLPGPEKYQQQLLPAP
ncbi:MAG: penicillin amidase [Alishewanella sp. 34-51-39]|nr:MAG: penicillin amidase [Alishewanella sp. 34-51-39]